MNSTAHPGSVASVRSPALERLLAILVETSFHASAIPTYPLASGMVSPYYVDCKKALSYAEARRLVGDLMVERIDLSTVQAIGGLLLGAYPVAIAVSDAAFRKGVTLKVFVVRKEPKSHGLGKLVEGDVKPGDRVVIVDDVVTTGRSTIEAVQKSRAEDLNVMKVLAIIDREEMGGREAIERVGVPFEALLTLRDLIAFDDKTCVPCD